METVAKVTLGLYGLNCPFAGVVLLTIVIIVVTYIFSTLSDWLKPSQGRFSTVRKQESKELAEFLLLRSAQLQYAEGKLWSCCFFPLICQNVSS